MTPEVKIFEIVVQYSSTGHDATFRVQIWWKSAVAKLPKGRLESGLRHKKLALLGLVPAPIFFQNGPITPKIHLTLSPLDLSTHTKFGPDWLRFAGLIAERCFLWSEK